MTITPISAYGTSKFIVSATAGQGNYTTIQAAVTAASSGDTIFVRPGTYTENITLKVGVDIVSYEADALTPNVTISGTCTLTAAGTVSISGIRLQTNSAALLAVTGSAASIVNLKNCYLNCTNTTGITFSSSDSGARINLLNCKGDIGTTGITLFAHSSSGLLDMEYCNISNSGGASTASTLSAGSLTISYSYISFCLTTSGTTAGFFITNSEWIPGSANTTALIHGSTLGTGSTLDSTLVSGASASAISISASAVLVCRACLISSSNTNAITGSGTLNYVNLSFLSTSSTMNVSTQTASVTNPGITRSAKQPCFTAYNSSVRTDVTGDGTSYTLIFDTELADQGSNFDATSTFTAPYTGQYHFDITVLAQQDAAAMTAVLSLVADSVTYTLGNYATTLTGNFPITYSLTVPMTATSTAQAVVIFSGGAKVVDIYGAVGDPRTSFSGFMVC